MHTLLLFSLSLLGLIKGDINTSCVKYEESLYLNTALNQQALSDRYLDSLLGCGNYSAVSLVSVAKYYYHQANYRKSEEFFLKAFEQQEITNEQKGEAYYYMALACYYNGQNDEAIQYAGQAALENFNLAWSYNVIGLALDAKKLYPDAIIAYRRATLSDPHYFLAFDNWACALDRMRKSEEALQFHLLADSMAAGSNPVIKSNVTRGWRELRRDKEEFISAKEGFEKFPNHPYTVYDYGAALAKQEKYDEALDQLHRLLAMNPNSVNEWSLVAYLYDLVGEKDSALYYYKVCLKLDDNHAMSHHDIAILYQMRGEFNKGLEHIDRAIAIEPTPERYNTKINLFLWQHDFTSACQWAYKLKEVFPEYKFTNLQMGYTLLQAKHYDEALSYLLKYSLIVPGDDKAYNNLGRCYAQLGKSILAFQYFDSALTVNPENSYIYHNRAALYCDLGEYEKACSDLKVAIDKEYNWLIDEKLEKMKTSYCPLVNTNRKIVVNMYKGNAKEMRNTKFIQLNDSSIEKTAKAIVFGKKTGSNVSEFTVTTTLDNECRIYPNPSSGVIKIELAIPGINKAIVIKFYDLNGKMVLSENMNANSKKEMDLHKLGSGNYIVMFLDDRSVLSTQKLILTQ